MPVWYKTVLVATCKPLIPLQGATDGGTQNPPIARSWGFDPPSRHHSKIFKTYNLNVFSCECLLQGLSQWNSHRDRFVTLLCLGGFLALL